ncbi:hypothetical protein [Paracoccus aminovorans]|uniref:hypothetical protein n=1 Tax=Paracoccus aminovorans TaxID=34004 RepID=UPI002B25BB4D|nr:hypothetical protein [Paracoccus aminovorans]
MQVVIWGADESTTVYAVPLLSVPIDPAAMAEVTQAVEGAHEAAERAEGAASDAQAASSEAAAATAGASFARAPGSLNLRGVPLGTGYINKNTGAVVASPDWRYTGFIPLPASPLISYIGGLPTGAQAMATYAFYDANLAVVERANAVGEALLDVWADESAAARYVRVTIPAVDEASYQLRIVSASADRTPAASDGLRATIPVNALAAAHSGAYIGLGTGQVVTASASWVYTDLLPVEPGQVLSYTGSANTTVTAALSLYDAAGSYIRDASGLTTTGGGAIKVQKGRIVIPEGVAFVRASAATTQPMALLYRRGKEGVEYADDVIATLDQSEGLTRSRLRQAISRLLSSSALPETVVSLNGIGDSITVGANASVAANAG